MYTFIYWLNKVWPSKAERMATKWFPLYEFETPHDLSRQDWAGWDAGHWWSEMADGPWYDGCPCCYDDTEALGVYAANATYQEAGDPYECNVVCACTDNFHEGN